MKDNRSEPLGKNQRALLTSLSKDGSFIPHVNERSVAHRLWERGMVAFSGEVASITPKGRLALGETGKVGA